MKVGILTGGGDAPGLNIAVYTLTKLLEGEARGLRNIPWLEGGYIG